MFYFYFENHSYSLFEAGILGLAIISPQNRHICVDFGRPPEFSADVSIDVFSILEFQCIHTFIEDGWIRDLQQSKLKALLKDSERYFLDFKSMIFKKIVIVSEKLLSQDPAC